MAHRGNELVLHLLQAAALGDILEGYDHAQDMPLLDERGGAVFDWNRGAVLTPEDFIALADGFATAHALEDRAGGLGIGGAVGVAMVNDLMGVAAFQLFRCVAQGARGGLVDEG